MPRFVVLLTALCLAAGAQQPPQPATGPTPPPPTLAPTAPSFSPPPASAALLDDGQLDPRWFEAEIAFSQDNEVDYFWCKPGLDLTGHTLLLKDWEAPVMLHADRGPHDKARAVEITNLFPDMLWGGLSGVLYGKVAVSGTVGDLALVGRFVDVGAGSTKARLVQVFGSGESATWDLKIVDVQTGELLLAAHHRVCTKGVGNTLRDRLKAWSVTFGNRLLTRTVK